MVGFKKVSTSTYILIVLLAVLFIICSKENKEGFIHNKRKKIGKKKWSLNRLLRIKPSLMNAFRRNNTRCYKSRICYRGIVPGNYGTVNICKTKLCKGLNNKVCRPVSKGSKGTYRCCKNSKWVKNINDGCTMGPVKYCKKVIKCY